MHREKNKTKNLLWDLQQTTSGLLGLRTLSCTALSPLSPLQGALMLAAIPVLLPRASLPVSTCPPRQPSPKTFCKSVICYRFSLSRSCL